MFNADRAFLLMKHLAYTFQDFKSRIERYHGRDVSGQHDTEVYLEVYDLVNSDDSFPNQVQFKPIISEYLLEWGGMYRWLDRTKKEEISEVIVNVVDNDKQKFAKIRSAAIHSENDLLEYDQDIKDLYTILCDETFVPVTKKMKRIGRFGPTATGKLLHMLAPKICIIWDQGVVRGPNELGEDGYAYVSYLHEKWKEWDKVKEDLVRLEELGGDPAQEILKRHSQFLVKEGYSDGTAHEPITKLLDETNYGPSRPSLDGS